jgi:hypothetical protein
MNDALDGMWKSSSDILLRATFQLSLHRPEKKAEVA